MLALPAFRKRKANPALALMAEHTRRQGILIDDWTPWRAFSRADIWHLHFPDTLVNCRNLAKALLGSLLFGLALLLARRRGTRIVWTVHDLGSHDGFNPRLEALFWRFLTRRIDAYVCLEPAARPLILERFPALGDKPGFVSTLGGYEGVYPSPPPRAAARQLMGLAGDAVVLLHFGLIRHYKNVPHLLRTVQRLADPGVVLLVAGRPSQPEIERDLRAAAASMPQVRLMLRWIAPDEVSRLFAACDLVVLPYRRILNSGTVWLSMAFGRPVLLPDLGLMRAQLERFGPEWVRLYRGELTPEILRQAIDAVRHPAPSGVPKTAGLDWDRCAREVFDIYAQVMRTARHV